MPASTLYDNDRCLVSKLLPDGTRQRATLFSGFLSHYLFRDRYGRPGKGNDKGNAEGLVGYSHRNFMVPITRFAIWDAFNAYLEDQCRKRQADVLRGQSETIGERLARDLAACQRGMSVSFTTAAALVNEMMEARDQRRLLRLQRQLAAVKPLIIDELGFVPHSMTGAELLFELISQRYERGATLITSNLPFDEWTEVFGTERLTGALLDRLTHHVHIIEMNGDSYRLGQSRARQADVSV